MTADPGADPFGTDRLRRAVLTSWRDSPTRFREDANAEEDLRFGGYRDRLFVELAQNAADAAALSGIPGRVRVSVRDNELRVANSGASLDAEGVAALASLRASAKRSGQTVGRFGVGFAAVLAVSDEIAVVSRSGAVAFSLAHSRSAAAELPELAGELAERSGSVPVLRLPWPVPSVVAPVVAPQGVDAVPDGFDTEVRLRLRPEVDAAAVLANCAAQAADLLLALPALHRIEVGAAAWWREDTPDGAILYDSDGSAQRWLLARSGGELSADVLAELGTEARKRPQWTACWAVPLSADERPLPLAGLHPSGGEVLHAPTASDERLSLPARLIATLPIDPDRRRVQPGSAADEVLDAAATHYPDLLTELVAADRTALVPLPGFPVSEVDGRLRESVLAALHRAEWLPGAAGDWLSPSRAVVLDSGSDELADLLADVVPGLLDAELAAPRHADALAALGIRRLRAAEVAEALSGVDRDPAWWHDLYAELSDLVAADPSAAAELGALPVPLADGRTVTGARDVLLPETDADLLAVLSTVDDSGLRVVHPDAVHPLLERLGARSVAPAELLDTAAMRDAVDRSVADAEAGLDSAPLADAVLMLVDRAGIRPGEHPWLGALALTDAAGDPRRADELLLPASPLRPVLAESVLSADGVLGILSADVADRWPASLLTAVGVLDSWPVLTVDDPSGPDHDLADEDQWWHWRATERPPHRLVAVRDLDLVADDQWPAALRLLLADPQAKRALDEPHGYTQWWLSRHARLAGHEPRHWRMPAATRLTGLYDPIPDVDLPPDLLAAIGVRTELRVDGPADAHELLARLADPARTVAPGTILTAHRELADAVLDGRLEPSTVDPPAHVRALTGDTVAAEDAAILDGPWLLAVADPSRLVATSAAPDDLDRVDALAELLDLPLAVEHYPAAPTTDGTPTPWSDVPGLPTVCALLDLDLPDGFLRLHDTLTIRCGDTDSPADWWLDDDQHLHATATPSGLARALCWRLATWLLRHQAETLLATPTAQSLLT